MQLIEMLSQEQLRAIALDDSVIEPIILTCRLQVWGWHIFFICENAGVRARQFRNDVTIRCQPMLGERMELRTSQAADKSRMRKSADYPLLEGSLSWLGAF